MTDQKRTHTPFAFQAGFLLAGALHSDFPPKKALVGTSEPLARDLRDAASPKGSADHPTDGRAQRRARHERLTELSRAMHPDLAAIVDPRVQRLFLSETDDAIREAWDQKPGQGRHRSRTQPPAARQHRYADALRHVFRRLLLAQNTEPNQGH